MAIEELKYEEIIVTVPTYEYSRIYPQSSATLNITADGQESVFEIPPKCFNFSKASLNFTMTPIAGTHFNNIHCDGVPFISQIQLYTRSGLFLCNITSLNKYLNTISRRENKLTDVQTWSRAGHNNGFMDVLRCPKSNPVGGNPLNFTGNVPTIAGDANITVANMAVIVNEINRLNAAIVNRNGNYPNADTAGSFADDPIYYIGDGVDTEANPVIRYMIPLERIKYCILSQNKDICFNEVLYLKLIWAHPNITGFNTTARNLIAGSVPIAGYAISGLLLYLPIEKNEFIIKKINDQIAAKFTYAVNFVYTQKIAKGAELGQSLSIRVNRSHGNKIKKIFYVPYAFDETGGTAFLHTSTPIVEYYTTINNVRRTQHNILPADGLDWLEQKESLTGSCVTGSTAFYYGWCHVEDFTHRATLTEKGCDEDRYNDGLLLELEQIYNVNCLVTTNAPLMNYFFIVCAKELVITPQGITLM